MVERCLRRTIRWRQGEPTGDARFDKDTNSNYFENYWDMVEFHRESWWVQLWLWICEFSRSENLRIPGLQNRSLLLCFHDEICWFLANIRAFCKSGKDNVLCKKRLPKRHPGAGPCSLGRRIKTVRTQRKWKRYLNALLKACLIRTESGDLERRFENGGQDIRGVRPRFKLEVTRCRRRK